MAKRNTNTAKSAAKSNAPTGNDNPAVETTEGAVTTSPGRSMTTRPSLFGNATRDDAKLAHKAQALSEARQKLAEAYDAIREGGDKAKEGQSIAGVAGKQLASLRTEGLISAAEVSDTLGGIFGFRKKGDAKTRVNAGDKDASRTPFGEGEMIRKRIVRVEGAHAFVNGGEASAFFDGLDEDEVSECLETLTEGEGSIWTFYEQLAEMKRKGTERLAAAFNPRSISAIADKLSEPGAIERLVDDTELQAAYDNLVAVLQIIGEGVQELAEGGKELEEIEAEVSNVLHMPPVMQAAE